MLTLKGFKEARGVPSGVTRNTSPVYSSASSEAIGSQTYIKPGNTQVTGACKIRGVYYKISILSNEEKAQGLATASAGNHTQDVAYATQAAGVSATVVVPTTTPLVKASNTKDYGTKVVLHDGTFDGAAELVAKLSEEEGLICAHPFSDSAIATGQGIISYKIFRDLPDVDATLVPIGGGGLAAGVSTLAKLLNPNVTIISVGPSGVASMKANLGAGHIVTLNRVETIAGSVAVKTPGDQIFPYIQKNIDNIITIPDDELVDTFLDMMEGHKIIVGNTGLLPIAALSHLKCHGKNVVPVLSDGNMDIVTVASLVQRGLINRGQVFTFSVQLPDRPGELLRVVQFVAEANSDIIKLEHNQFVDINRQSGVELRVILEAFSHTHKRATLGALCGAGYTARECHTNDSYHQAPQAQPVLEPPAYPGEPFSWIRLYDAARFLQGMGHRAGAAWTRGRAGGAPGVIRSVYLMCPLLRLSRPRLSPETYPTMEF